MVSQPPPTEVSLVFESLEASSQLEASSRTLWPRRQQIGVATGLLAQRFVHHPERAWSLLVRVSQKRPCQGSNIAQAIINAHCGRLSAAEVEILSVIEMHIPDGARLIGA